MTEEEIQFYADANRETIYRAADAMGIDKTDPVAMESLLNELLRRCGYTLIDGVWHFAKN